MLELMDTWLKEGTAVRGVLRVSLSSGTDLHFSLGLTEPKLLDLQAEGLLCFLWP